ncbi:bifunctional DNA-binding transcriptional regulator/O6-methylguanine-DNA methyltransferase Ada [Acuticoccus sp. MNP-M23]|uniref:bifunctional DNA-binding transcriptional regulator/O6-methylguanine-DNA methyltransferase Ada n=1 Tax=Acuticoccus sp. MNP-M23 TaxID=3072793 RepID=UPI002815C8B1|nr:bifunctional DNA-binding transcriptional regulator/O6-methylguanine-DNA methyltransferase Ada [Acuticoccus sp. MNP-M23]WMS44293.1 bifunctional DNA-binding transcriptional regulator/O6-methylguanine-DNA methyltransferase Ada [Acuticoccus sp. MNP-M23]
MAVSDAAWRAIEARDGAADGAFVYAVVTTGVYCRPSCPSRQALRRNVFEFRLPREAVAAGYRPCKRCKPGEMSKAQRDALAVEAVCRTIEAADRTPPLAELAASAGLSQHHFHRIFKAHTGVTPKAYGAAHRARRVVTALAEGGAVTDAAFRAGFESLSRFYDLVATRFGVAPAAMAAGGRGEVIVLASGPSAVGVVTAAFSRVGIAGIVLCDTAAEGRADIEARFRHAIVVDGGADFEKFMVGVLAAVAEPRLAAELPLDIRGTAFEERVWSALRRIPVGTTASYAEIARAIGAPTAHRAVARACGANGIAVAIPCHRVVRADGSLAGYRWGVPKKAALIEAERGHAA